MYEHFYGFKKKPFQLLPDADFLFRSKKHDIVLTYLEYAVYNRAGFVVITGEIGTGKTTILNYLLRTLKRSLPVLYLSQTCLNPEEFLRFLCQEFSLPHEGKGKAELIELFGKFLVEQFRKGQHVILILDEAQNLPLETLEEIRMLSNLDAGDEALLQIILVGQPALRDKLRRGGLRQLAQRVEVSYHLGPLDLDETKDYIRYRIERAEGPDPDLFADAAMEEIYNYSEGIPRLINAVCHMCLVYGMADELKKIDHPLVGNVLKDRSNWDLLPVEKDLAEKEPPGVVPAFADTVKIEGVLRNLESKLGLFIENAASFGVALEKIVARLPEGGNSKGNTNPSEESMALSNQGKDLLSRLSRMEETIAAGVKNQNRLIELLLYQKNRPTRRRRKRVGAIVELVLAVVLVIVVGVVIFHFFIVDFNVLWARLIGKLSFFFNALFL
jgi:general secretion pathway protein A